MRTYAIVRRSGWTNPRDLARAASLSARVALEEMPGHIEWVRSYVLEHEDGHLGTICIFQASDAEAVREHARRAGMPVSELYPVKEIVVLRDDPRPQPAGEGERTGAGHGAAGEQVTDNPRRRTAMAQEATSNAGRERQPLNGVDVPTLFATINAVRAQPELAKFKFRASNKWLRGTHSRGRIESFTGAGSEHSHASEFQFDADHPKVLVGQDQGPTPVEFVLHSLAACLTAGIGNIAAARGITLNEVESTVEGEIDLRGLLGLADDVRNGYNQIRVSFKISGDAPPEKLREIVEQSRRRSAVFDVITSSVPIDISVDAAQVAAAS